MTTAFPYLEQVKECYQTLRVTDAHFLWSRGVPFFEIFIEKSGDIVRAVLNPDEARSWYGDMLPHLDENGQEQVKELLRVWETHPAAQQ